MRTVAQRAPFVDAPRLDRARGEQGNAVLAAGGDGDRFRKPPDLRRGVLAWRDRAVADLPVAVFAPPHHGPAAEQRQRVLGASGDRGDPGEVAGRDGEF